ncbi:MAG: hypothetical protein WDW38_008319 [Sanguina aurantia]
MRTIVGVLPGELQCQASSWGHGRRQGQSICGHLAEPWRSPQTKSSSSPLGGSCDPQHPSVGHLWDGHATHNTPLLATSGTAMRPTTPPCWPPPLNTPAAVQPAGGEGGMGSRPQWCGAARRMRLRLNGGSDAPVDVFRRQASMFLLHDGTLITIFLNAETQIVHPILAQLGQVGTLVRDSEDASFLANLLIDAIVDYHQPVVDAYTTVLERYESAVLDPALGRPVGRQTRELYLMQGDLTAVKRAIAPAHSLVLSLLNRAEDTNSSRVCFSRLSRTYLQDVLDHSSTLAEHVEDLTARSQELINLIFNLTSHHTNQATQTLSNISVVFLPITFIAGVYGTNFVILPEKDWTYGYLYFWIACSAVTVAFVATLRRMGMMRI